MADTKISALTAATSIASGDVIPVVQGGTTKKVDVSLFSFWSVDTGYTGGGATNLDGEATVSLPVSTTFRWVIVSGSMSLWQLLSGTDAENVAGGIIRPDDYNASTNAKIWKRVLGY